MFIYDNRLGISIPDLPQPLEGYSIIEQHDILLTWEIIRGKIPDRMLELESIIKHKQSKLEVEEDFLIACTLNTEIAHIASIINDLWLWYRANQPTRIHG